MTLTVRLDQAIEAALSKHCAELGVTKSLVVQESLAAYLLNHQPTSKKAQAGAPSALFKAFEQAGLIGTGQLGAEVADKQSVRRKARGRVKR